MKRILFLGEGEPAGPARYLAAILTAAGVRFDHQPDQKPLPRAWMNRGYAGLVLSDYRASSWTPHGSRWVARQVERGAGLLMIGGWASFTGQCGGYRGTALEALLPVRCLAGDDRVQRAAIWDGLARPPVICGYQRCQPRAQSRVDLYFRDLNYSNGGFVLGARHPGLVRGGYGAGKTAAFMTDCAPHWAGTLVDWGKKVRVRVPGAGPVEVGDRYLRFFGGLIKGIL